MKTRILAILMAICMVALFVPTVSAADNVVAKIGTVEYSSLAAAVAAVEDGDEIELLKTPADGDVALVEKAVSFMIVYERSIGFSTDAITVKDGLNKNFSGMSIGSINMVAFDIGNAEITYHSNYAEGEQRSRTVSTSVGTSVKLSGAYIFTAPTGKWFKAWAIGSVDGPQISASGSYTVESAATDIYAIWSDTPYHNVTYTDGVDTEFIFANQVYRIAEGDAVPAFVGKLNRPGYDFAGWTVSTNLRGDVIYTAKWVEDAPAVIADPFTMLFMKRMVTPIAIKPTLTEGGTISYGSDANVSEDGEVTVRFSKDVTITITPDEGYIIADVLIDGESVGAVSEYTFTKIRKAHDISVVFEAVEEIVEEVVEEVTDEIDE